MRSCPLVLDLKAYFVLVTCCDAPCTCVRTWFLVLCVLEDAFSDSLLVLPAVPQGYSGFAFCLIPLFCVCVAHHAGVYIGMSIM